MRSKELLVLKVGGSELDSPDFMADLARLVADMETPPIIVHGGGKGTSLLSHRLGLSPRFVEGLRVTDQETLEVAIMGTVGLASTLVVQALTRAGVPALGLSGVDAGLVRVERFSPQGKDLGWVGRPVVVDVERLEALQSAGFVPCLAPIGCDASGNLYNVNADQVAGAVAAATHAAALVFVTSAPGVVVGGKTLDHLSPSRITQLIAQGIVFGGMIPKVRSACEALEEGVNQVLIVDRAGLAAWIQGAEAGTEVRRDESVEHAHR